MKKKKEYESIFKEKKTNLYIDVSNKTDKISDNFKSISKESFESCEWSDPKWMYTMGMLMKIVETYGEIIDSFADKLDDISMEIDLINDSLLMIEDDIKDKGL